MSTATGVFLTPYSPLWPAIFEVERERIARHFITGTRIEHIGSTAVPGLGGKGIIDVLVGVPQLADAQAAIPALVADGYRYVPEFERALPQRRFFSKTDAHPGAFHIHAVVEGSDFWKAHLAFRDALRGDAGLAADYWRLKQRLAARFPQDRAAYTDGKESFIREVLGRGAAGS